MVNSKAENTPNFLMYAFVFGVCALVSGLAGYWLKGNLTFVTPDAAGTWLTNFWGRFQVLFLLAVLIERSVETYLNATRQNGEEFFDVQTGVVVKTRDAKQPAMIAALVLSVLVALSGVRIIETLVTLDVSAGFLKSAVWYGVDIMVSAGLMAGGADLFHKLAEVITSGLDRVRSNLRGESSGGVPSRIDAQTFQTLRHQSSIAGFASVLPSKTYTINIARPVGAEIEEGTIEFKDDGVTISATCWWDKVNRIDAGTYTRCSKTHMATLKIEAIYLPDAVSKVTGAKEIFIHRGSSPDNSNGCIAVEASAFATLWQHIKPLNGQNVTVVIKDV